MTLPFTFHKLIMKNTHLAYLSIIGTILLGMGIHSVASGHETPEELARRARELRLEARAAHCEQLGQQMARCWGKDKSTCKTLTESKAAFSAEYGTSAEEVCGVDDPLTSGAALE